MERFISFKRSSLPSATPPPPRENGRLGPALDMAGVAPTGDNAGTIHICTVTTTPPAAHTTAVATLSLHRRKTEPTSPPPPAPPAFAPSGKARWQFSSFGESAMTPSGFGAVSSVLRHFMSEMSKTCSAVLRHTATRLRLSFTERTAVRKFTSQIEWSFLVFQRHSRRGLSSSVCRHRPCRRAA